jgi:hypothetical protein
VQEEDKIHRESCNGHGLAGKEGSELSWLRCAMCSNRGTSSERRGNASGGLNTLLRILKLTSFYVGQGRRDHEPTRARDSHDRVTRPATPFPSGEPRLNPRPRCPHAPLTPLLMPSNTDNITLVAPRPVRLSNFAIHLPSLHRQHPLRIASAPSKIQMTDCISADSPLDDDALLHLDT